MSKVAVLLVSLVASGALPGAVAAQQANAAAGQRCGPGDDGFWTPAKIERLNAKYGIHDYGYHFHYPRGSFLELGYYPPGGYVKDFSILRYEGRWHVFHIDGRCDQICWITGNEISFGHCSTDDLQHWIRHPMPLAIGDSELDNLHVWAPFVYPFKGRFFMFYMGNGTGGTSIARATSDNLERWTKCGPIKEAKGRDPFVFEHEGKHILVFTAHYEVNGCQALGACSSRDLKRWTPLPEILLTTHGGPESASVHRFDDTHYVLWANDWGDSSEQHPRIYRACYVFSEDPLRFDGTKMTTFRFIKGKDALPFDAEFNEPHKMYTPVPAAIELVAKGENKVWLVAYYRMVGNGFRLFFGELDWTTQPATIREISTEEHLQSVLSKVRLRPG